MGISIQFLGVDEWFRQVEEAGVEALKRAVDITGREGFRRVRALTPSVSGRTRARWQYRLVDAGMKAELVNRSPSMARLEFGGYGRGPDTVPPVQYPGANLKRFTSRKAPSGILGVTLYELEQKEFPRTLESEFSSQLRARGLQ